MNKKFDFGDSATLKFGQLAREKKSKGEKRYSLGVGEPYHNTPLPIIDAAYDSLNSGLPRNHVREIAIDSFGNKWIGTAYGGLAVFKEGGVVAVKYKKPSVSSVPLIISLYRDSYITRISYSVLKPSHVVLKVFDIKGIIIKSLVNDYKKIGEHKIDFNTKNISNGTFFINLQAGNNSITKKLVVLK